MISRRFLVIACLFVTCLITANIVGVKVATLGGLLFPAAVVFFPLSYIFGDILTEVYGYSQARRVIWLGFFCNLMAVILMMVGQLLPPAQVWHDQASYERILGRTPWLLCASFAGYLVGEFSNSFVLAKMKIRTKGRWLWTRTIGSTVVGEGLDTLVFISALVLFGVYPGSVLLSMVITCWLAKTGFEAIATPLTYAIVNFLKKKEGIDTYDYQTNFNPLLITK
jgi:hypothetical protein